jgi:uncharacterized protein YhfF
MNDDITIFWQRYLASLPDGTPKPTHYEAWSFGDSAALAAELADLVLRGIKTATCASLEHMQHDGDPLPEVGGHSIVTDFAGKPQCIIETTEVTIQPFDQVDAQFAFDEGEDDRSLESWRAAHRRYFTRTLPEAGLTFREDMPLVCERFRRVFV